MAKNISYNVEARDALKRGVDQLANPVNLYCSFALNLGN